MIPDDLRPIEIKYPSAGTGISYWREGRPEWCVFLGWRVCEQLSAPLFLPLQNLVSFHHVKVALSVVITVLEYEWLEPKSLPHLCLQHGFADKKTLQSEFGTAPSRWLYLHMNTMNVGQSSNVPLAFFVIPSHVHPLEAIPGCSLWRRLVFPGLLVECLLFNRRLSFCSPAPALLRSTG